MHKKEALPVPKNRIPRSSVFTQGSVLEESEILSFRSGAYAFFGFLGSPQDTEFSVQVYFSSTPLNAGEDQVTLERKIPKSYILDRVLLHGRKRKSDRHPVVNVSFEKLFTGGEPFDGLLNFAEGLLARETSLHISFPEGIVDPAEVSDDTQVEIFFHLGEWEGGVLTNFRVIRDYFTLAKS